MKRFIIYFSTVFLLIPFTEANAQKHKSFGYVDPVMLKIPDNMTTSSQQIADYINSHFSSQEEKSRAIYCWIANNIYYDINSMYVFNIVQNDENKSRNILETRKGTCNDYTLLFQNIAEKVGIETYIVTGYTKKKGQISGDPHAWIAFCIDSSWYLSDPTWGSGYFQDGFFIKSYNTTYFKVNPAKFVKSHMPFDPIWQFLNHPITKKEFQESNPKISKKTAFFNFTDSIQHQKQLTRIEKLESIRDRTLNNGVANYLDYDHLIHLQSKIAYYYDKKNEAFYYSALTDYNSGVQRLNEYIGYKNKYYIPFKSDEGIKQMISDIEEIFNSSLANLNQIEGASSIGKFKNQLYKSIKDAMADLNTQKSNLGRYLEISKSYREHMPANTGK